jgi:nitrous oxidase accessory protein NosD
MRRFRLLFAIAVGLVALTALPAEAATTWYVSDATGNDLNNCTSPITPCKTIQAAIGKASAGDTINVAAGTYPEPAGGPLTVNKTLTLLGAQAGVDARSRVAAESTVTDPQGTSVSASDVVIDGFTWQDSTVAAFTGYGVWLNPGVNGTDILNNIFQSNIVGLGLANAGATQAVIRHNVFRNNNQPGGASGSGIYTDQFVGGPVVRNVLVDENTFTGNNNAGIDISNVAYIGGGVYDLDVTENTFTGNGRGVLLFNTHDMTFHDNRVTNSTLALSAAVRIFDNNTNLSIQRNDITDGVFHGIRLSGAMPSSGVTINYNNIERFPGDGLLVDPGSHTGTVDAECNWWNSPTGPTNPGNPGGTGEEVVGDADFSPWLVGRAPTGRCVGIVSTPGKVTGGGQLQGDPLFSALGDLISAPALVPSLSGSTAQATFGFVVRCCPASGNLEYNDHSAGVRIKATSIAALNISDGACGPRTHATFTGTASVIRSAATTTEDFTVDVDDCGEPGTTDTFAIETTTYSNGPSVLIGGNIQIHK